MSSKAALMPEGIGALAPTEAEGKPRIRVRLHFGGTFAQDDPRQWRYVGGEVYNESFPMDSKYAEVSKRLNDKFGDTVSFKYLCPGDDVDPDNLVQVQGDDDLLEMCDEYQNALQKPSTPVKTVRIKVFVFRAVIFEREVQELDEELDDEDELMDLPDDGALGELLSSCDHDGCGPNWSDWGEPVEQQEVTESSLPSVHLSSDVEVQSGVTAAVASAAATAALHNISMSANSGTSGRTTANVAPAPLTAVAVPFGASIAPLNGVFMSSRLSPRAHAEVPGQRNHFAGNMLGATPDGNLGGGDGLAACNGTSSGGNGGSSGHGHRGELAALGVASSHGVGARNDEEETAEATAGAEVRTTVQPGARTGPAYTKAAYGDGGFAGSERWNGEGEKAEMRAEYQDEEHQQGQQQPLQNEWPGQDRDGAHAQWRGPVQEDWQDRERVWERDRLEQQERQQTHRQQEQHHILGQKQEMQHLDQRGVMESTVGFYCDEELEDPYRELYEDAAAAAAGAGLGGMHIIDGGAGRNRISAASDGAVRMMPRAADLAAYGDHLNEQYHAYAIAAGGGGNGAGLLGRLPAAADMLPRHISAFGESSRDDSQGGAGSGSFLPSRITIFGDDESLHSTQGAGGSFAGLRAGGGGLGLHRLAVLGASGGGAGTAPWPDPSAAAGDAAGKGGTGGGYLGGGDDIVACDSRLCITQEFGTKQQSSMLELGGNHGSGDAAGDGGGRVGGRVSPLDPLDPLMRTGLGVGLGLLGLDGLDNLSPASGHNHPLKGVVKKRKSEVSIMAKIGEGAFGEVSQAQVFPYGIVAIKWLKRERFAKYSESFQREAETLAKLNHPNIIRMYGLVMDTPDTSTFASGGPSGGGGGPHGGSIGGGSGGAGAASGSGTPTGLIGGIITEFVRNGSLGQYLRSLNGRRLSLHQRAMIALQAALGMAYLHEQSPAVVHFDLKPDNLLVDGEGDSMVIKVADFGLSKHKLSNYVSCRDLRGTLPYMAYELVSSNGNISEKVDVYSMGVVMWEMYTGEVPFAHLTAQEILTGLLHGNLHLAIPPACESEWRSLVETCMDPNPTNRPSFQELAMQLQEMMRLERQASNASSVSAAAAAAAVAAVLDSTTTPVDSGGAGGVQVPGAGVTAAAGAGGGGVGAGLGQWRMPSPLLAPITPGQPQARSPAVGIAALPQPPPIQPLLARQQLHPGPPQPHLSPLLAPLAQQVPQPQHFQLQQPYGNVPYGITPPAQQQQAPRPQPPPPPPPQLLQYAHQLTPGLVLQQPPGNVSPPHHFVLPLRPPALFQPQQQHAQHMNGLYGLGGGAGGSGLPPLVSWGDRGM